MWCLKMYSLDLVSFKDGLQGRNERKELETKINIGCANWLQYSVWINVNKRVIHFEFYFNWWECDL